MPSRSLLAAARHRAAARVALVAAGGGAGLTPPADADATRCSRYAARHVGVVRRDDRPGHRACRPTASTPTARASVQTSTDQHRRLHVERGRRRAARDHRPRRGRRPARRRRSTRSRRMERHEPSGQFYNWYDHRTGAKLTVWPPTGEPLHADPVLGRQRLAGDRRCRSSRTPSRRSPTGPRRSTTAWTSASTTGRTSTGSCSTTRPTPATSPCCYDTIVSESRIASYIGIAKGELPAKEYFGAVAHVPRHLRLELAGDEAGRRHAGPTSASTCSRAPTRTTACASCPGWGGSMFEALMPALFVPEERVGARAAGRSTTRSRSPPRSTTGWTRPATATGASRRRTSRRAATTPTASTRIGMNPDGYPSNEDNDARRPRLRGLPGPRAAAGPAAVRLHERRRHAARRVPRAALGAATRRSTNLRQARARLPDIYGKWGFRDSVNVDTGAVVRLPTCRSTRASIMAAIGNALGGRRAARRVRDQGGPEGRSGRSSAWRRSTPARRAPSIYDPAP